MPDVQLVSGAAARDIDAIRQLAQAAEAADGHPPLNDAVWRDLAGGAGDAVDVLARASSHGAAAGYAHAARGDNEAEPVWEAAFVVAPAWRGRGVDDELLGALVAGVAERGGGGVVLWCLGATDTDDALAARHDFRPSRTLLQMRVALPLASRPAWPDGVTVRPFEPGRDEVAWVAVNNRAFAGHPEQGGWTVATLRARAAEPWFDRHGFLLAERDRELLGFCWTKMHQPQGWGEIYVVGVDPTHGGGGLGRALVIGGLEYLARQGAGTGLLFVDAANGAAVGLYRSLGFETERTDRAYERDVD